MDREPLGGLLDELDAVRAKLASFDYAVLTGRDLVAIAERGEHAHRQDAALDHTVYAALADRYMPEDYGGRSVKDVLAARLHLDTAHIAARFKHAEQFGPRWSFTGEQLEPVLAHTAAGLARGEPAVEHVEVIRKAVKALPGWIDEATRAEAERDLAHLGAGLRPEDLRVTAERWGELVDPDGAEPTTIFRGASGPSTSGDNNPTACPASAASSIPRRAHCSTRSQPKKPPPAPTCPTATPPARRWVKTCAQWRSGSTTH
jgi:hypothetical protein